MKGKLSWRRDPIDRGLRRVIQGPRGWMLWYIHPDGKTEEWLVAISHYPQVRGKVYVVVVQAHGLPYRNTLSSSDRQPRKFWSVNEVPELKKNLRKWVVKRFQE